MTDEALSISWEVPLADLTDGERCVGRELSQAECAALARHAGIQSVGALKATAKLRRRSWGAEAEVGFDASVVQSCVVTLDPVQSRIAEHFTVRYLPANSIEPDDDRIDFAADEEDPPEPFEGDSIDLGPMLTEHFVLALNPYPRKYDAELPAELQTKPQSSAPFAVLRQIRDKI
jgi:uncharacterized metal-binding protein YceD (DUF177 family)